jgi:hypothetical protein
MARQSKTTVENQEKPILADEFIELVSLTPYKLNLSTEPSGKGRVIKFEKFGDTRRISYSDLTRIIETNQTFLESGYFYILDERVIKKHGLSYAYEAILTKDKLEQVFNLGTNSIALYKSASDVQKKFIHQIIIDKLIKGEDLDLNLVSQIEKIGGINLMQLANEAKESLETEK